jgi:hypothetical protein
MDFKQEVDSVLVTQFLLSKTHVTNITMLYLCSEMSQDT